MNLVEKLKSMPKLTGDTKLKITCTDKQILTGNYFGYTQALDNEPEIAQIEIIYDKNGGLVGLLETGIESIEVI